MAIYRQDLYNYGGDRVAELAVLLFSNWASVNDTPTASVADAKMAISQAEIMIAQLKTQRDLVKQSAETAFPPIPT
jgi:hypothetical protein